MNEVRFKDMKTGEECAEEIVKSQNKRVRPLLAEVDFEGWMLFWTFGEGKSCIAPFVSV